MRFALVNLAAAAIVALGYPIADHLDHTNAGHDAALRLAAYTTGWDSSAIPPVPAQVLDVTPTNLNGWSGWSSVTVAPKEGSQAPITTTVETRPYLQKDAVVVLFQFDTGAYAQFPFLQEDMAGSDRFALGDPRVPLTHRGGSTSSPSQSLARRSSPT